MNQKIRIFLNSLIIIIWMILWTVFNFSLVYEIYENHRKTQKPEKDILNNIYSVIDNNLKFRIERINNVIVRLDNVIGRLKDFIPVAYNNITNH